MHGYTHMGILPPISLRMCESVDVIYESYTYWCVRINAWIHTHMHTPNLVGSCCLFLSHLHTHTHTQNKHAHTTSEIAEFSEYVTTLKYAHSQTYTHTCTHIHPHTVSVRMTS